MMLRSSWTLLLCLGLGCFSTASGLDDDSVVRGETGETDDDDDGDDIGATSGGTGLTTGDGPGATSSAATSSATTSSATTSSASVGIDELCEDFSAHAVECTGLDQYAEFWLEQCQETQEADAECAQAGAAVYGCLTALSCEDYNSESETSCDALSSAMHEACVDGQTSDGYTSDDGYTSEDGYTSDGYTSDGYTSDGYTSDGEYTSDDGYTSDGDPGSEG